MRSLWFLLSRLSVNVQWIAGSFVHARSHGDIFQAPREAFGKASHGGDILQMLVRNHRAEAVVGAGKAKVAWLWSQKHEEHMKDER